MFQLHTGRLRSAEESIVLYHSGHTFTSQRFTNFTPVFLDVLRTKFSDLEWNQFNVSCKGVVQCIFDLAVTGWLIKFYIILILLLLVIDNYSNVLPHFNCHILTF